VFFERPLDERETILENAGAYRGVEDRELQLAPHVAFVLPAHDAHGPLEMLAAQP